MQDETLKRAFVRSIEIIGEASKKVSSKLTDQYPEVNWKAIAGMRDQLVHDYFGVDHEIVWDVLDNKIPALHEDILKIIDRGRSS